MLKLLQGLRIADRYRCEGLATLDQALLFHLLRDGSELHARLLAAQGAPLEVVGNTAGEPIPGESGDPPEGEKRKLPPPAPLEQDGASSNWAAAY